MRDDVSTASLRRGHRQPPHGRPARCPLGGEAWPGLPQGLSAAAGALKKLAAVRWLGTVSARKGRVHGGGGACPRGSLTALPGCMCWVPGMCCALFIHSLLDGRWVVSRFLQGQHPGGELQGLHYQPTRRVGVAACGALAAFPSSLGRTSFPLDIPLVKRLIKSFANFLLVCLSTICSRVFFFFNI